MKKSILNVLLAASVIFGFGILNLVLPDRPTVSELENRNLKAMPAFTRERFLAGDYLKEFDLFFSDAFIFRDRFITIANRVKDLYGFKMGESVEIIQYAGANAAETAAGDYPDAGINVPNDVEGAGAGSKTETPEREAPEGEVPEKEIPESELTDSSKEVNSLRGGMLIYGDRAMEVYKFSAAGADSYARAINLYRDLLDSSINIYSLLAPTQIEFIEDERYRELSDSQRDGIEYVNNRLAPGIIPIMAYDEIEQNKDKYLYFRSDHHWTALGAYYAYRSFARAAGQIPTELDQFRTGYAEGYLGSTYSITLSERVAANPDKIIYYLPPVDYTYYICYSTYEEWDLLDLKQAKKQNKYRLFLSGDRPLGKIVTGSESDRKILVIKDSYGNAFVPFLIPHYKEIYIVDPRQFEQNILEFIGENQINDILFLNYVMITNFTEFHNLMTGLTQK
ncbi:DHHW family protein [Sinanaerobacter chloroacetimidivorans]|uniref:DHHW protein n=1 Tax=Sinanaerobacter chloroacetimidivorans TaxID=2818044 RepID=A0A8J7W379_9FIRM|nr:DHHW family protein [Sinanaerobacter chloroacetimidivorans]MBR0599659.1 hypothetical protein [Sinanaerobacter chloroacetimidivorans]